MLSKLGKETSCLTTGMDSGSEVYLHAWTQVS